LEIFNCVSIPYLLFAGETPGPQSLLFEIQRAFGINIHGSFTIVDARVLKPPALGYRKRG
jgi:hypothetical protein